MLNQQKNGRIAGKTGKKMGKTAQNCRILLTCVNCIIINSNGKRKGLPGENARGVPFSFNSDYFS